MKILLIIFFTSLFFLSCKETPETRNDIFITDIPTSGKDELDYYYQRNKIRMIDLGLDNIENGSDTLKIRIWYNYELLNFREVLEIKYENFEWSGNHYAYCIDWTTHNENEKIYNINVTEINPKSGWNSFISKLLDKQVVQLPNMHDIEGLDDSLTDGENYNVEISTSTMYRFYSYHSPEYFKEFWQPRKMLEILDYIESEIHIKTLRNLINNNDTNKSMLPGSRLPC